MKKFFLIALLSAGTLSFANGGETPKHTENHEDLAGTKLFINSEEFSLSDVTVKQNEAGENVLMVNDRTIDLSKDIIAVSELNSASLSEGVCLGDFTGDGVITIADLVGMLGALGGSNPIGDFDCDGFVNTDDLPGFLAAFGTAC